MKLKDYKLDNWKGGKILEQLEINELRILLLDTVDLPPEEGDENLLAIGKDENILWIAELPTKAYDICYSIVLKDGIIIAYSSNSFIAEIDPATGKIIKSYMFK